MPISSTVDYIPVMDEFISHWTANAPSLLIADPREGAGPVDLGQFGSLRDDLDAVKTLLQSRLNDLEGARVSLEQQRGAAGDRIAEFNRRIRADLPNSPAFNRLPLVPNRTAGRDAFLDAMDDMLDIWARVNALPSTPLLPTPMELAGGLSRAEFLTLRGTLDAAFTARGNAERAAAATRLERNGLQDYVKSLMVSYRAKIEAMFDPASVVVATLPRVTPLPGRTPDPVVLTASWDAADLRAELTWTESAEPDLASYQIRAVPGPDYAADDETLLATVPAGAPRSFASAAGLALPGAAMSYKVYVRLTTGNEAGSNPQTVSRP